MARLTEAAMLDDGLGGSDVIQVSASTINTAVSSPNPSLCCCFDFIGWGLFRKLRKSSWM